MDVHDNWVKYIEFDAEIMVASKIIQSIKEMK
jgi:hypothetical protein